MWNVCDNDLITIIIIFFLICSCHKQFAKYTCPKCNIRYCSITCYKAKVCSMNCIYK